MRIRLFAKARAAMGGRSCRVSEASALRNADYAILRSLLRMCVG